MVPLDAKGSKLNKDDKHRNNSSHFPIVISLSPSLAWADSQYCSQPSRRLPLPRALRKRRLSEPETVTGARESLRCLGTVTFHAFKHEPNVPQASPLSLETFPVSLELHPRLAYVYSVPPSSSRTDAAQEKSLVLLLKVRCYEDVPSGDWMFLERSTSGAEASLQHEFPGVLLLHIPRPAGEWCVSLGNVHFAVGSRRVSPSAPSS